MRASQEGSIDAPAAALWEPIGEPSLYPRFLRDVTRWEKIAGDEGSRPRYHIEVRVGGVELGAVVEITHASAPHELGWESVSGIEHHGHWRVRSDGDRRCTVALDLSYRAPGGVLGMIADGAALPLLHQGLRESLARLKAEVEGSAPARGVVARIAGDTREAVYDAGVLARRGLRGRAEAAGAHETRPVQGSSRDRVRDRAASHRVRKVAKVGLGRQRS